jgi:outer membrane immunogenic protein
MVEPGAFLNFSRAVGFGALASPLSDPETPFSVNGKPWSYTAGGFAGYYWQQGNYVFGFESDVEGKNGQSSNALYATTLATYTTGDTALRTQSFYGSVKQTWDSSARVRAGFLATPWTLIYATGGLAVGEESGSFGYAALANYATVGRYAATSGAMSWSETMTGWTAGGGVEQAITLGWKIRIEYRYTEFGSFSKNIPLAYSTNCGAPSTFFNTVLTCSTPGVVSSNAQVNMHPSFQTIRLGVGFTF